MAEIHSLTRAFHVLDLIDTFTFGKHKGETVFSVLNEDPSYILWVHQNTGHTFKTRILECAQQQVDNQQYYHYGDSEDFVDEDREY